MTIKEKRIMLKYSNSCLQVNAWSSSGWGCLRACWSELKQDDRFAEDLAVLKFAPSLALTLIDAAAFPKSWRNRYEFWWDSTELSWLTFTWITSAESCFILRWSERPEKIPVFRPDDQKRHRLAWRLDVNTRRARFSAGVYYHFERFNFDWFFDYALAITASKITLAMSLRRTSYLGVSHWHRRLPETTHRHS